MGQNHVGGHGESRGLSLKEAVTLREAPAGARAGRITTHGRGPMLVGEIHGRLSPVGGTPRCLREGL